MCNQEDNRSSNEHEYTYKIPTRWTSGWPTPPSEYPLEDDRGTERGNVEIPLNGDRS